MIDDPARETLKLKHQTDYAARHLQLVVSDERKAQRKRVGAEAKPVTRIAGLLPEGVVPKRALRVWTSQTHGGITPEGASTRRNIETAGGRGSGASAGAGGAGGANPSFVDGGGPVLDHVQLQLIYWGSSWVLGAPVPTSEAVTNAVRTLCASTYMNDLTQYRNIRHGRFAGITYVTTNPPNPFDDGDVTNMISNLLEADLVAEPDANRQILYLVVMPPNVQNTSSGFIGEHSYFEYFDYDFPFDFDYDSAHFAWVTNSGTLASITSVFSHELVESCTDPEGSAITGTQGTCVQGGWCEIGDVCYSTAVLDGVTAQRYFSESAHQCVIPAAAAHQWGGWEGLGGILTSPPKVVSWGPERLDVFARGTDHALYHRWWAGAGWGGWESLGGVIQSPPEVVSWGPNRLDIFAIGNDNHMYHRWWGGSSWGGWESLGGSLMSTISAVSWQPNRLDVFALGTDHAVYHRWWDGTHWGGWESLGGVLTSAPKAVAWGPNRLDIFALGVDHSLQHRWWSGSTWGGWESLGNTLVGDIAAVSWDERRLDLFGRGLDSSLQHRSWAGTWSAWESLGGTLVGSPEAVSWAPNRLDVFAVFPDSALHHRWREGNSAWGGWESLGGTLLSDVTAAAWCAQRLDLFAVGADSTMCHRWFG